jgi:hypothetical protein
MNPINDKYNWKRAVYHYLISQQSFSLFIRLENGRLLIEASEVYNPTVIANIWDTINETIHILHNEDLITKVTRINVSSRNTGEIIICCYQNEQPVCLIDIDEGRTIFISEVTEIPSSDTELSNEDWLVKEFARAAQYEQAIMQPNKTPSDCPALSKDGGHAF